MGKDTQKKRQRLIRIAGWTCLGLLLLSAAFALAGAVWWNQYLPDYLANRLIPEFRRQAGFHDVKLKIRRVGLTGCDLEALTLIGKDGRTLGFDSVRADYTPHLLPFRALRRLDITNLTLSGGQVHVSVKSGKITVSGIDLDHALKPFTSPATGTKAGDYGKSAVILRKITLRNLWISLDFEGRHLDVPTFAVLTAKDPRWRKIHADLVLTTRGRKIAMSADYDADTAEAHLAGTAALRLESFSDLIPFPSGGDAKLKYELDCGFAGGDVNAHGTVEAEFDLADRSGLPATFKRPVRLSQNINLRYRPEGKEFNAILSGEADPVALVFDQRKIRLESEGKSRWKVILSDSGDGLQVSGFKFTAGPVRLDAFGFTVRAPLLRFEQLDGFNTVSGSGITAVNPKSGWSASGIDLLTPLPPNGKLPATLNIGSIRRNGTELGAFRGSFQLDGNDVILAGNFENRIFPEIKTDVRGTVSPRPGQPPDLSLEVRVPPWRPKTALKLSRWRPEFGDATGSGVISLTGTVRYENGKLITNGQILLESGSFNWPEHKLRAEDIRLDLNLDDLVQWETPGNQILRIGTLNCRNFELGNVAVRFDVTSPEQLDIERAEADWCGGTVTLDPVRLNPSHTEKLAFRTELNCENLNLSELVTRLGFCKVSGKGTLSGRIPIGWSVRRGLSVLPGNLYSRPGGTGTFRLTDPEKFGGGAAAVRRNPQLDFALDALRSFTYNWAAIRIEPKDDALRFTFQFEGTPDRPLPFVYDEDTGKLRRDPSARAIFKGIQLDVAADLPFGGSRARKK